MCRIKGVLPEFWMICCPGRSGRAWRCPPCCSTASSAQYPTFFNLKEETEKHNFFSLQPRIQEWNASLKKLTVFDMYDTGKQGVTKRCLLSWLTNSALVYEPICWGIGGRGWGVSASSCACTWSTNKLWRSNFTFNLYVGNNAWNGTAD
jgi:hypothetical protein